MQRTELPATWTLDQALAHYATFTTTRLTNTRTTLQALGAHTHPDIAIGLAALAQLDQPALDLDAVQATTAHAAQTAAEVVCTNDACTGAYSPREACECTCCNGDGHGLQYETERAQGRATAAARTATHGAFHRLPTAVDVPDLADASYRPAAIAMTDDEAPF